MKFLTVALFVGAISADQLDDIQDAVEALKIRVSKAGMAAIDKEANDIPKTLKKIKDAKSTRNLKNSLEKFAMSKEIMRIKKIDEAFMKSKEGQELIAEWKDVGDVLEENLMHNKTGVHFPNDKMDELSDELSDVVHEYEELDGSKWDKAYTAAWKDAFESKHGQQFVRRVKTFRDSAEGKALHKEVVDLKNAVKTHVKVTDLPDHWKDEEDLLKIEVNKAGQAAIEKEFNDIKTTAKKIKGTKPVRNLKSSLQKWGKSDEVAAIKALDKKFLASPEGKELIAEWKDFGEALKTHVKKTKNGVHIDNQGWQIIEDEADDVEHEYKMLEKSRWAKLYENAWTQAVNSPEGKQLGRRMETFGKSKEWKMLEKELKELDMALKKHVKVSDLPKDMQEEMELLKIEISKAGQAAIEKEVHDFQDVAEKVKTTRSVRNLKKSIEKWAQSPEVAELGKLNETFWQSKNGKDLAMEINDFAESLKEHVKETKNGVHIDDAGYQIIEDEADDIDHQMEALEKTKWPGLFEAAVKKTVHSKAGQELGRRMDTFGKSAEWKALEKELKDIDAALKKHVQISDVPKDMDDLFVF